MTKANNVIFDAANFVAFWTKSNLSEGCNIASLLKIKDDNPECTYFNTGLASGSLKKYKQHLPNQELKVYRSINTPSSIELDFTI